MFKNLDGFKKIKEDDKTTVMQHPKGHTITIAMKSIPVVHRRQLQSLPMHKACGGAVKLAEGGPPIPHELPPPDRGVGGRPEQDAQPRFQDPYQITPEQYQIAADNYAAGRGGPPGEPPNGYKPQAETMAPAEQDEESGAEEPVDNGGGATVPPKKGPLDNISPESIYGLAASGVKETAAAQKRQAGDERIAAEEYQNDLANASSAWEKNQATMAGQIKSALQDVTEGKIDPKHYMENMSAGSKVSTAIGLFLGGLSSPFTGQGNPALEMLNKQIDRDIDAQKTGLNNKMNIYHAYLDQYKNAAAAESMTRATQLAIYGQKLKMAALNNSDPLIEARAKQGLAQIQQAILPQVINAHLLAEGAKFSHASSGPGGSEAEYQVFMRNASQINPQVAKDAQEKYIPGIGTTAIPASKEDISELSTYKNLNELAKEAQDFAQTNGRTFWGTESNQRANDLANNLRLQLGQLVNLKRINEYEAKKYDDLVRSPGSWNQGAAIQSFKDLRNDIQGKTKGLVDKYQIKPFRK